MKLAMMFQNGMVLQRDRKVAVWGTAQKGETVSVTMQGKTATASAGEDGKWMVQAGPFAVSEGETMTISSGEEQIVLSDVAVGEVWLAGGQSNMEYYMRYDKELEKEKEQEPNPLIRFFDYPEVSYVGQLDEADYSEHYGFWRKADAEDLQWWSAVPYYYAKELHEKLQVPIGILGCNWGGTTVSCWIPEDVLKAAGGQFILDDYREATKDLNQEEYDAKYRANPVNYRTDQLTGPGHEIQDWIMSGDYADDMMQKFAERNIALLKQAGIDPSKIDPAAMMPPMGPRHEWRPCGLYESMLLPVVPYTIRGVIWYQGESDGDDVKKASSYHQRFSALISHWRKLWKEPELPFLFVQIAPYRKWMMNEGTNYGIVRKEQQWVADHVTDTGMAVITDNGMEWDIHPVRKRPVGHRLARLAENKVYGDASVPCEAPTLIGAKAEEGKLTLTFDHAEGGLHFSWKDMYGHEMREGIFDGLCVIQDGKELDRAACKSTADGDHVIVRSDEIHAGVPTTIRIAEDIWYDVNLYNGANLPARPAEIHI